MIESVEKKLWAWGDWCRGDLAINKGGTVIGRLMKRKRIEDGFCLDCNTDIDLLDDDEMIRIDSAIGKLKSEWKLLCVLRYKAGRQVQECATRLKINRNTVTDWIDKIHNELQGEL